MAPFKLKFRKGGNSRSTSQEHDPDPQVNEALLNHHTTAIGTSNSTIDSFDCNSLGSLGNGNGNSSERKSLLPATNNQRLGYTNQSIGQCIDETAADSENHPETPPPSYEQMLKEVTRVANPYETGHQRQFQVESANQSRRCSRNLDDVVSLCTDPDCQQNYNEHTDGCGDVGVVGQQADDDDEARLPDSNEHLSVQHSDGFYESSNEMNAPSSCEHLLDVDVDDGDCSDENCSQYAGNAGRFARNTRRINNAFYDPLLNHNNEYDDEAHSVSTERCASSADQWQMQGSQSQHQQHEQNYQQQYQQYQQPQSQQQQQQQLYYQHHQSSQQHDSFELPKSLEAETISNRSSKQFYKQYAKELGITCKMSNDCRCMECQGNYFDCEYDDNEHQKHDGGLGAGTPMFLSEVMHGSACTIL